MRDLIAILEGPAREEQARGSVAEKSASSKAPTQIDITPSKTTPHVKKGKILKQIKAQDKKEASNDAIRRIVSDFAQSVKPVKKHAHFLCLPRRLPHSHLMKLPLS